MTRKDPFDEPLLVQAQDERLELLASDLRLAGDPLVPTPHGLS